MKCIFILCGYLIASISCVTKECKLFEDEQHGFGCWIKEIKIEAEEKEIKLIAKDDGRNESEVIWIQILDSVLLNLPTNMFEKFVNMEKIFIENSTGFKTFDNAYFDVKIKYLHFTQTDMEYVGDKVFAGLISVDKLYLHNNKITSIHKNAFKDLESVDEIYLNHNLIEHLNDDVFMYNLNLKFAILDHNRMKTINAKLFSRNINLENIEVAHNSISNIEENVLEHLEYLKIFDLSSNICADEMITGDIYIQWLEVQHNLSVCFQNFKIKREFELILKNNQLLTEQLHELRNKTGSNMFNNLMIFFVVVFVVLGFYLLHKRIQRIASGFESHQFTNLQD